MTNPRPQHAPLDQYFQQYEDLARDGARLTNGLSADQLTWSPEPGRWSIAQCLDHLNSAARPYLDVLEAAITQAREKGLVSTGAPRYSWFERWMIRSVEPPPRRRLPAPPDFQPKDSPQDLDAQAIVRDFAILKERFLDLLRKADGLAVDKFKITSPVTRLLRLRVGAAFAFLASHERRHLWQARQVREHADFPAS